MSYFLTPIQIRKAQIKSLIGQIKYCEDRISSEDTEQWEKKEYVSTIDDCVSELFVHSFILIHTENEN